MKAVSLRGNDAVPHDRCQCGRLKFTTEYVCATCYLRHHRSSAISWPEFRLVARPRYNIKPLQRYGGSNGSGDLCSVCPKLEECRQCILDHTVLACEWADDLDAAGKRRPRWN